MHDLRGWRARSPEEGALWSRGRARTAGYVSWLECRLNSAACDSTMLLRRAPSASGRASSTDPGFVSANTDELCAEVQGFVRAGRFSQGDVEASLAAATLAASRPVGPVYGIGDALLAKLALSTAQRLQGGRKGSGSNGQALEQTMQDSVRATEKVLSLAGSGGVGNRLLRHLSQGVTHDTARERLAELDPALLAAVASLVSRKASWRLSIEDLMEGSKGLDSASLTAWVQAVAAPNVADIHALQILATSSVDCALLNPVLEAAIARIEADATALAVDPPSKGLFAHPLITVKGPSPTASSTPAAASVEEALARLLVAAGEAESLHLSLTALHALMVLADSDPGMVLSHRSSIAAETGVSKFSTHVPSDVEVGLAALGSLNSLKPAQIAAHVALAQESDIPSAEALLAGRDGGSGGSTGVNPLCGARIVLGDGGCVVDQETMVMSSPVGFCTPLVIGAPVFAPLECTKPDLGLNAEERALLAAIEGGRVLRRRQMFSTVPAPPTDLQPRSMDLAAPDGLCNRWYFELHAVSMEGTPQVGWSCADARFKVAEGRGVGDDAKSWSWCMRRCQLFHGSAADVSARSATPSKALYAGGAYGRPVSTGERVGCSIDLERGDIRFYDNDGKDFGVAFRGVASTKAGGAGLSFFPSLSFSGSGSFQFVTGVGTPLKNLPSGFRPLSDAMPWVSKGDAPANIATLLSRASIPGALPAISTERHFAPMPSPLASVMASMSPDKYSSDNYSSGASGRARDIAVPMSSPCLHLTSDEGGFVAVPALLSAHKEARKALTLEVQVFLPEPPPTARGFERYSRSLFNTPPVSDKLPERSGAPPQALASERWAALWATGKPVQEDGFALIMTEFGELGFVVTSGKVAGGSTFSSSTGPVSAILSAPDSVPLGRWTCLGVAFDRGAVRLYVDGKCVFRSNLFRGQLSAPSEAPAAEAMATEATEASSPSAARSSSTGSASRTERIAELDVGDGTSRIGSTAGIVAGGARKASPGRAAPIPTYGVFRASWASVRLWSGSALRSKDMLESSKRRDFAHAFGCSPSIAMQVAGALSGGGSGGAQQPLLQYLFLEASGNRVWDSFGGAHGLLWGSFLWGDSTPFAVMSERLASIERCHSALHAFDTWKSAKEAFASSSTSPPPTAGTDSIIPTSWAESLSQPLPQEHHVHPAVIVPACAVALDETSVELAADPTSLSATIAVASKLTRLSVASWSALMQPTGANDPSGRIGMIAPHAAVLCPSRATFEHLRALMLRASALLRSQSASLTDPRVLVLGVSCATAALSLWLCNCAVAEKLALARRGESEHLEQSESTIVSEADRAAEALSDAAGVDGDRELLLDDAEDGWWSQEALPTVADWNAFVALFEAISLLEPLTADGESLQGVRTAVKVLSGLALDASRVCGAVALRSRPLLRATVLRLLGLWSGEVAVAIPSSTKVREALGVGILHSAADRVAPLHALLPSLESAWAVPVGPASAVRTWKRDATMYSAREFVSRLKDNIAVGLAQSLDVPSGAASLASRIGGLQPGTPSGLFATPLPSLTFSIERCSPLAQLEPSDSGVMSVMGEAVVAAAEGAGDSSDPLSQSFFKFHCSSSEFGMGIGSVTSWTFCLEEDGGSRQAFFGIGQYPLASAAGPHSGEIRPDKLKDLVCVTSRGAVYAFGKQITAGPNVRPGTEVRVLVDLRDTGDLEAGVVEFYRFGAPLGRVTGLCKRVSSVASMPTEGTGEFVAVAGAYYHSIERQSVRVSISDATSWTVEDPDAAASAAAAAAAAAGSKGEGTSAQCRARRLVRAIGSKAALELAKLEFPCPPCLPSGDGQRMVENESNRSSLAPSSVGGAWFSSPAAMAAFVVASAPSQWLHSHRGVPHMTGECGASQLMELLGARGVALLYARMWHDAALCTSIDVTSVSPKKPLPWSGECPMLPWSSVSAKLLDVLRGESTALFRVGVERAVTEVFIRAGEIQSGLMMQRPALARSVPPGAPGRSSQAWTHPLRSMPSSSPVADASCSSSPLGGLLRLSRPPLPLDGALAQVVGASGPFTGALSSHPGIAFAFLGPATLSQVSRMKLLRTVADLRPEALVRIQSALEVPGADVSDSLEELASAWLERGWMLPGHAETLAKEEVERKREALAEALKSSGTSPATPLVPLLTFSSPSSSRASKVVKRDNSDMSLVLENPPSSEGLEFVTCTATIGIPGNSGVHTWFLKFERGPSSSSLHTFVGLANRTSSSNKYLGSDKTGSVGVYVRGDVFTGGSKCAENVFGGVSWDPEKPIAVTYDSEKGTLHVWNPADPSSFEKIGVVASGINTSNTWHPAVSLHDQGERATWLGFGPVTASIESGAPATRAAVSSEEEEATKRVWGSAPNLQPVCTAGQAAAGLSPSLSDASSEQSFKGTIEDPAFAARALRHASSVLSQHGVAEGALFPAEAEWTSAIPSVSISDGVLPQLVEALETSISLASRAVETVLGRVDSQPSCVATYSGVWSTALIVPVAALSFAAHRTQVPPDLCKRAIDASVGLLCVLRRLERRLLALEAAGSRARELDVSVQAQTKLRPPTPAAVVQFIETAVVDLVGKLCLALIESVPIAKLPAASVSEAVEASESKDDSGVEHESKSAGKPKKSVEERVFGASDKSLVGARNAADWLKSDLLRGGLCEGVAVPTKVDEFLSHVAAGTGPALPLVQWLERRVGADAKALRSSAATADVKCACRSLFAAALYHSGLTHFAMNAAADLASPSAASHAESPADPLRSAWEQSFGLALVWATTKSRAKHSDLVASRLSERAKQLRGLFFPAWNMDSALVADAVDDSDGQARSLSGGKALWTAAGWRQLVRAQAGVHSERVADADDKFVQSVARGVLEFALAPLDVDELLEQLRQARTCAEHRVEGFRCLVRLLQDDETLPQLGDDSLELSTGAVRCALLRWIPRALGASQADSRASKSSALSSASEAWSRVPTELSKDVTLPACIRGLNGVGMELEAHLTKAHSELTLAVGKDLAKAAAAADRGAKDSERSPFLSHFEGFSVGESWSAPSVSSVGYALTLLQCFSRSLLPSEHSALRDAMVPQSLGRLVRMAASHHAKCCDARDAAKQSVVAIHRSKEILSSRLSSEQGELSSAKASQRVGSAEAMSALSEAVRGTQLWLRLVSDEEDVAISEWALSSRVAAEASALESAASKVLSLVAAEIAAGPSRVRMAKEATRKAAGKQQNAVNAVLKGSASEVVAHRPSTVAIPPPSSLFPIFPSTGALVESNTLGTVPSARFEAESLLPDTEELLGQTMEVLGEMLRGVALKTMDLAKVAADEDNHPAVQAAKSRFAEHCARQDSKVVAVESSDAASATASATAFATASAAATAAATPSGASRVMVSNLPNAAILDRVRERVVSGPPGLVLAQGLEVLVSSMIVGSPPPSEGLMIVIPVPAAVVGNTSALTRAASDILLRRCINGSMLDEVPVSSLPPSVVLSDLSSDALQVAAFVARDAFDAGAGAVGGAVHSALRQAATLVADSPSARLSMRQSLLQAAVPILPGALHSSTPMPTGVPTPGMPSGALFASNVAATSGISATFGASTLDAPSPVPSWQGMSGRSREVKRFMGTAPATPGGSDVPMFTTNLRDESGPPEVRAKAKPAKARSSPASAPAPKPLLWVPPQDVGVDAWQMEFSTISDSVTQDLTSLLVVVSGSKRCRDLLTTPEWIETLAILHLTGSSAIQRRTGRVLRAILPESTPDQAKVTVHDAWPLAAPSGAKDLAEMFLLVAAAAATPGSSLALLPPSLRLCVSSSSRRAQTLSEALATLRVLLDAPLWRSTTTHLLVSAIDSGASVAGPMPLMWTLDTTEVPGMTQKQLPSVKGAIASFQPVEEGAGEEALQCLMARAKSIGALGVIGGVHEALRPGAPVLVPLAHVKRSPRSSSHTLFSKRDFGDAPPAPSEATATGTVKGWVVELSTDESHLFSGLRVSDLVDPSRSEKLPNGSSGSLTAKVCVPASSLPEDDMGSATGDSIVIDVPMGALKTLPLVPPCPATCPSALATAIMNAAVVASTHAPGDLALVCGIHAKSLERLNRSKDDGDDDDDLVESTAQWNSSLCPSGTVLDSNASLARNGGSDATGFAAHACLDRSDSVWEWVVQLDPSSETLSCAVGAVTCSVNRGKGLQAPSDFRGPSFVGVQCGDSETYVFGESRGVQVGPIRPGDMLRFVYDGLDGSLRVWKRSGEHPRRRRKGEKTPSSEEGRAPIRAEPTPEEEANERWEGGPAGWLLMSDLGGEYWRPGGVLLDGGARLRLVRLRQLTPVDTDASLSKPTEVERATSDAVRDKRSFKDAVEARLQLEKRVRDSVGGGALGTLAVLHLGRGPLEISTSVLQATCSLRALSRLVLIPGATAKFLSSGGEPMIDTFAALAARQAILGRSLFLSNRLRGLSDLDAAEELQSALSFATDMSVRATALTSVLRDAHSLPHWHLHEPVDESSLQGDDVGRALSRVISDTERASAADAQGDGPFNRFPWRSAPPPPSAAVPVPQPAAFTTDYPPVAGLRLSEPASPVPATAPAAAPAAVPDASELLATATVSLEGMGFSPDLIEVALRRAGTRPGASVESIAEWLVLNLDEAQAEATRGPVDIAVHDVESGLHAMEAVLAEGAEMAEGEDEPQFEAQLFEEAPNFASQAGAIESMELELGQAYGMQQTRNPFSPVDEPVSDSDLAATAEIDASAPRSDVAPEEGEAVANEELADDLELEEADDEADELVLDAADRFFPDDRPCAGNFRGRRRGRGGDREFDWAFSKGLNDAAPQRQDCQRAQDQGREQLLGSGSAMTVAMAENLLLANERGIDGISTEFVAIAFNAGTILARRIFISLLLQWQSAAPASGEERLPLSVDNLVGELAFEDTDVAILRGLTGNEEAAKVIVKMLSERLSLRGPGEDAPSDSPTLAALRKIEPLSSAEAVALMLRLALTRGAAPTWADDVDLSLEGAVLVANSVGAGSFASTGALALQGVGSTVEGALDAPLASAARLDSVLSETGSAGRTHLEALSSVPTALFRLPSSDSGVGGLSSIGSRPEGTKTGNVMAALVSADPPPIAQLLQPALMAALITPGESGVALTNALASTVSSQLAQAALRRYRGTSWSASASLGMSDVQAAAAPSLTFVRWLTGLLLDASTPSEGKDGSVSLERAVAAESRARVLFSAWAPSLRSAAVSLKEQGFRQLGEIIERVRSLMMKCPELQPAWPRYLAVVPASRIEALASRRLDAELEDAPRTSRYLQCLVEFASLLRFVRHCIRDEATRGATSVVLDPVASDSTARPYLRLLGGRSQVHLDSSSGRSRGSSRGKRGGGGGSGSNGWTLELWVRRVGDPGLLAAEQSKASGGDARVPLALSQSRKVGPPPSVLSIVPLEAPSPFPPLSGDTKRSPEEGGWGGPKGAPSAERSRPATTRTDARLSSDYPPEVTQALERAAENRPSEVSSSSELSLAAERTFSLTKGKSQHRILASGGEGSGAALLLECGQSAPERYHHAVGLMGTTGRGIAFEYEAPVGHWVHLAFVCEASGSVGLLVNGHPVGAPVVAPGGSLSGLWNGLGGSRHAAEVDILEARLWRAPRSRAELCRDMVVPQSLTRPSVQLAGQWLMREGKGSYVADTTGQIDRCYGDNIDWGLELAPPVSLPLDEVAVEAAERTATAKESGDAVAASAAMATASLQGEARSGLVGAMGQAPGASWRGHAGYITRESSSTLGGEWATSQRLAMHLEFEPATRGAGWRKVAVDYNAATLVRRALDSGEEAPTWALARLDPTARIPSDVGTDAGESKAAEAETDSKDSSVHRTETAPPPALPKDGSVWIEGELEIPEALIRCRVVGTLRLAAPKAAMLSRWGDASKDPWEGGDGDGIASLVTRACDQDVVGNQLDGKLELVVCEVLEGAVDRLPYLLGLNLHGTASGERVSGSWDALVRAAPPRPPPPGAVMVWHGASEGMAGISSHPDSWVTRLGSSEGWRSSLVGWRPTYLQSEPAELSNTLLSLCLEAAEAAKLPGAGLPEDVVGKAERVSADVASAAHHELSIGKGWDKVATVVSSSSSALSSAATGGRSRGGSGPMSFDRVRESVAAIREAAAMTQRGDDIPEEIMQSLCEWIGAEEEVIVDLINAAAEGQSGGSLQRAVLEAAGMDMSELMASGGRGRRGGRGRGGREGQSRDVVGSTGANPSLLGMAWSLSEASLSRMEGVLMWQFVAETCTGTTAVGLTARGESLETAPGMTAKTVALLSNGNLAFAGTSSSLRGGFTAGDVVGVMLDWEVEGGQLSFFVNGKCVGICPVEVSKLFGASLPVPFVSISDAGDSVRCLGLREGAGVRLEWAEDDARSRVSLSVPFVDGMPHGIGRLELRPAGASGIVAITGPWQRGERFGIFAEEHSTGEIRFTRYAGRDKMEDTYTEAQYHACRLAFEAGERARLARIEALTSVSDSSAVSTIPERRVTACGEFKVDKSQLFVLMPSCKAESLVLDDNLTEVSMSRGDTSIVLGSRGFTRGVHYWEVFLDVRHEKLAWEGHNPYIYVGVAERWGKFSGGSWRDFGLVNYMAVNSSSEGERLYGEHMTLNDRIGVLLDMDHGVISFLRDGRPFGEYKFQDFGPAYTHVRSGNNGGPTSRVFFPCIGLRSGCEPITIHHQKWVTLPGGTPEANLNAVLEAATLLQRWERPASQAVQLPPQVEAEAYARYVGMVKRPNIVVARARGGVRLPFDRSTEACTAVLRAQGSALAGDLRGGDRIKFWGKEAEVVGAYRGRLWYRIDGEDAWYLEGTEFDDCMSNDPRMTCVLPRPDDVRDEVEREQRSTSAAAAGAAAATEAFVSEPVPSSEEFSSWIGDRFWTLDADQALVRMVNSQCDRRGVDPANLRLMECPAGMLRSLRCPSQFADEAFLPRLRARFAVILCLNWRLESLIPLVDFSLLRRSGVLATADSSRLVYSSALGRRFASLRGLCFGRLKRTYFSHVLQVTAKNTPPGGDNFTKPSEVPELTVNRRAADMEKLWAIPSLSARLKRSVLGQLIAATNSWGDSKFRRDFAWHEDEGQKRNFFVRLQGESANDNGGPYRAVIEAAAAQEPAGPVSLFIPCPNALEPEQGGGNREFVVMNPAPWSPPPVRAMSDPSARAGGKAALAVDDPSLAADLATSVDPEPDDPSSRMRLSEYRMVGRLAGSAVRHDMFLPADFSLVMWRALAGEAVTAGDLFSTDQKLRLAFDRFRDCRPAGVTSAAVQERVKRLQSEEEEISASLSDEELVSLAEEAGASEEAIAASLDTLRSAADVLVNVALSRNPDAPRAALRRAAGRVTFATRASFELMVLDAVARSAAAQLRSWASGVASVLPVELFPMFTTRELQVLFCGSSVVDVSMLKRVAEFPSGLTHETPHVRWLFEVLEEGDDALRSSFISFVAARNRMPQSADGFTQTFKINQRNPKDGDTPDNMLPMSATCFFELKIPAYSSKEILRQKLTLALESTFEMDDN
jgi:hypothetical protein